MTKRTINPQPAEETTGNVTLHDILRMVAANWYWFVISAAVCLGAAYYYLASTPRIYSRTATILVKDSRKGGDTDLAAFSDLAGFQNRRSVDNEVFILQSRRLMSEVVRRLGLTTDYSVRDGLRTRDLYGQSPLRVRFIDETEDLSAELTSPRCPTGGCASRISTTGSSPSPNGARRSSSNRATRRRRRWERSSSSGPPTSRPHTRACRSASASGRSARRRAPTATP